jgi:hypothetical protein
MATQTSFLASDARRYRRQRLAALEQAEQRNGWHPDASADLRPVLPTSTATAKNESSRGGGASSILDALNRAG